MSPAADVSAPSSSERMLYRIPIVGFIARTYAQGVNAVFYLLALVVVCLVLAVKIWGLVALTVTGLVLVPVMFAFFVAVSLP
ncbi:MAG: hypothetical protein IAE87_04060 [Rhodobacteraceae bacterium]|jgi:hypothetical protein|nr:hypothetical protein [Paracoccaceae bacterium]